MKYFYSVVTLLLLAASHASDARGRVPPLPLYDGAARLKNLCAGPDDETSPLLLAVDGGGQGAGARKSTSDPLTDTWAPEVTNIIGGADPSDLIGEWTRSEASTIDFRNPSTGVHAPPSGKRFSLRFFPDGRYIYVAFI